MAELPEGYAIQPPKSAGALPEGYSIAAAPKEAKATTPAESDFSSATDFFKFVARNVARPWVEMGEAMGAAEGLIPPEQQGHLRPEKTAQERTVGAFISGATNPMNVLAPGMGPLRTMIAGGLAGLGGEWANKLAPNSPMAPAIGGAAGGAMAGRMGAAVGAAAMLPHALHSMASHGVRSAAFNTLRSLAGSLNPTTVARNIQAGIPRAAKRAAVRATVGELAAERKNEPARPRIYEE
jgi:hypothetical protein